MNYLVVLTNFQFNVNGRLLDLQSPKAQTKQK